MATSLRALFITRGTAATSAFGRCNLQAAAVDAVAEATVMLKLEGMHCASRSVTV